MVAGAVEPAHRVEPVFGLFGGQAPRRYLRNALVPEMEAVLAEALPEIIEAGHVARAGETVRQGGNLRMQGAKVAREVLRQSRR